MMNTVAMLCFALGRIRFGEEVVAGGDLRCRLCCGVVCRGVIPCA